jgi:cell division protein FtsB
MKLLSFRFVKLGRVRVSRHLLPVGRRELDQDLLDESDRQEGERAEIRMIQLMIVKWKGHVAAASQYKDSRNELIENAPSPWLLRLVPPSVRLFAEQEHRGLGELSSRLSYLAQRLVPSPNPNELHQRIDQVLEEIDQVLEEIDQVREEIDKVREEIAELRRSIERLDVDLNEEWQRRAAVRARAKQFCKHISAREGEYFTHIRRLRGIALEAGLWRFLPGYWTDDSRLSWAFSEVAKLEDLGQAERPPYLAFLNALFVELGPDAIEGLKKESLKQEIRERWPPECGLPSDNLVDPMATILRSLKARRGGAKPQKKR